jgi:pimeloyl-ACP methyl ester carboxylesterase
MQAGPQVAAQGAGPRVYEGQLASGAKWRAEVPPNWNRRVLLWSHGYSPRIDPPTTAPPEYRDALLAKGYALLASDYGAAGWSLEQAVPAQRDVVGAFEREAGRPRRVLAWGASMGGLVTTALVEQPRPRVQGGVALCPSIGGAVGMMNMGLDGAFAFRTLVAPDAGLELADIRDDMANSRRAQAALDKAMTQPAGRARVALAGVLAGLPGWTRPDAPQPAASDHDAQVKEMAAAFVMGVILPRVDQERRAGGAFSWNDGVDYAEQLRLSGRRPFVEALYRQAGLDLDADLRTLAAPPRIKAAPKAVAYMMANYTPTARPGVPIVSVQAIGDGLTSPSLQRAYVEAAPPNMARGLWVEGAGHCRLPAPQVLSALELLEQRLDRGRWTPAPAGFTSAQPAPMLRPCLRGGVCR